MVFISACLAGEPCRYDGKSCDSGLIKDIMQKEAYMLICPEVLGGLSAPRPPCEIQGGTAEDVLLGTAVVRDKTGADKTKPFIAGAEETLRLAKKYKPTAVYLKSKSPSCGAGVIYDGSFSGKMCSGNGVTAELLIKNGFKVISV